MTIFLYLVRRLDEFKTFPLQYSITVSLRRSSSVKELDVVFVNRGCNPQLWIIWRGTGTLS